MVHTPHPLLTEHGDLIQVILSLHLNIIIINPLTRGDHQHALCLFPLKTSGHFLLTGFLFVTAFLELLHPLHQHFHLSRRLRHLNTRIQESRSLHTLCTLYGQEFEPRTQFTDPFSEQMDGRLAHIIKSLNTFPSVSPAGSQTSPPGRRCHWQCHKRSNHWARAAWMYVLHLFECQGWCRNQR